MVASLTDTLVDLGVPGIVGAAVGAAIAHYAAKARGREEHERTLDLLVLQDERRTALTMLDAIRELRARVTSGAEGEYGLLHNEWNTRVLGPARIIRDPELFSRAEATGYVIVMGTLFRPDEYLRYAPMRGMEDVEEWLEAWLRRDEPPPPHLPTMQELPDLMRQDGALTVQPLADLLAKRAGGDMPPADDAPRTSRRG